MPSREIKENKSKLLKVEGTLSIYEVNHIRGQMLNLLEENDDIEINLSDVSECDVAGIQLILSALKTHIKRKINIENISDVVRETAIKMGIDPESQLTSKKGAWNEQEHYDC